jgi:hypothetical protein
MLNHLRHRLFDCSAIADIQREHQHVMPLGLELPLHIGKAIRINISQCQFDALRGKRTGHSETYAAGSAG